MIFLDLAKVAAALADPVRIAILELIANPPQQQSCLSCEADGVCVCEFVQHLRISQPRASYHLRILREANLVFEQPRGKWTFYRINDDQIASFCRELRRVCGAGERQKEGKR